MPMFVFLFVYLKQPHFQFFDKCLDQDDHLTVLFVLASRLMIQCETLIPQLLQASITASVELSLVKKSSVPAYLKVVRSTALNR